MVGIGYADTSSRRLGYAEFLDNEMFSNFEVGAVIEGDVQVDSLYLTTPL